MNPPGLLQSVFRTALCLAASGAFFAGCSDGGVLGTIPVGGKVSYKGAPVAGATVTFMGQGDARPAVAVTEADGTYRLKTLDSEGALPGIYSVLVTKTEIPPELTKSVSMEEAAKTADQPLPQPKELLPAKYGNPAQSPLKAEVKSGATNTFDFNLED
jgi:hypothetical protein